VGAIMPTIIVGVGIKVRIVEVGIVGTFFRDCCFFGVGIDPVGINVQLV
jgi:hypothetical protein